MPEKSSYYTGHEDLDKKLSRLYEAQSRAEGKQEDTTRIIKRQDELLAFGKWRDSRGSVQTAIKEGN